MRTLVLGGARSGKSRFAEGLLETERPRVYVATGRAWDDEMRERIACHRADRGRTWTTVEEPLDLCGALRRPEATLVDCLTLWVTNLMMAESDVEAETEALVASAEAWPRRTVFVSNEVGLGIVPGDAMSRAFRDHAGRLHQKLAAVCDEVFFVAAGLPLQLK